MAAPKERSPYRLRIGDVNAAPVTVVRAPHLSVLRGLLEAAAPTASRSVASIDIERSLSRESRQIFPTLGMPGLDRLPDSMARIEDTGIMTVEDHARWLSDLDGAHLTREIAALWGGAPPGPWRSAADRPRRWLDGASRAFLEAWSLLSRSWCAAEVLLRREEMRIGTAAVTGTLDAVLSSLSPRLRVRDDCLEFDSDCGRTTALGSRKLALVPMLGHGADVVADFENPDIAYLAYPLPGVAAASQRSGYADTTDGLALLLGPIRADVLRALDQPHTMRALAELLHCAPSTLTYHCDQLIAAGLLDRERRGRSVWISRTNRAIRLLDVFE